MSTFGQPLYGETQNNTEFFLTRLVDSLPAPYRPPETLDFLRRFLLPSAEDLDYVNHVFDLLDTYVFPESAPEEWLRWMLTEWLGWTLIPDGYPVGSVDSTGRLTIGLRRLLFNLHLHYKRRYTIAGVRELLREFGVVSVVTDRPQYVGGYYGTKGSRHPLNVRIFVKGIEAFSRPKRVYAGGYYGHTFLHTTPLVVTESFVMDLIRWSRAAGVRILVEWYTGTQSLAADSYLPDDDEFIPVEAAPAEGIGTESGDSLATYEGDTLVIE